jgi:hypothetical protein
MGHSKDPSPGILKLVSFSQSGVQPKEHFLGSLLGSWRMQPQREQVSVYVLASFFIQLAYFVPQRRRVPLLPNYAHELCTQRKERHSLTTKTVSRILPTTPFSRNFSVVECASAGS